MFSLSYGIGGTVFIKENDEVCSWIDIYGDLNFPDSLEDFEKKSILSFLDTTGIKYNRNL